MVTKEEYQAKLEENNKWENAIRQAGLDSSNPDWDKYLAVRQWLRDNFSADFLDLF